MVRAPGQKYIIITACLVLYCSKVVRKDACCFRIDSRYGNELMVGNISFYFAFLIFIGCFDD
jgi:hypothetical protein